MHKPLHPVVTDITHGLLSAERSNDDAIMSAAAMIHALIADRGQLQLQYGTIQSRLTDAAKGVMLAVEARAHLGRCHWRMHEIGTEHALFTPTSPGNVFPTPASSEPVRSPLPLAA